MKLRSGYTLLELLVTMSIASMVGALLYALLGSLLTTSRLQGTEWDAFVRTHDLELRLRDDARLAESFERTDDSLTFTMNRETRVKYQQRDHLVEKILVERVSSDAPLVSLVETFPLLDEVHFRTRLLSGDDVARLRPQHPLVVVELWRHPVKPELLEEDSPRWREQTTLWRTFVLSVPGESGTVEKQE